jgi:hypothetical protein
MELNESTGIFLGSYLSFSKNLEPQLYIRTGYLDFDKCDHISEQGIWFFDNFDYLSELVI